MKKIVALASAISMTLAMCVSASAAIAKPTDKGISFVYNAVESTADKAVVDVYLKGYEGRTVTMVSAGVAVDTDVFDISATSTGTVTKYITDAMMDTNTKFNPSATEIMVSYIGTGGMTIPADGLIVKYVIPVKEGQKVDATTAMNVKRAQVTSKDAANKSAAENFVTGANVLEGYSMVAGSWTKIDEVADSTVVADNAEAPKATYWTVEADLVSDATPYWYATVNDAAKKVKAEVPSVSGAAKLGLIVEGDDVVTNVKIVQE